MQYIQGGFGPKVYGSLPCYTAPPQKLQQPAIGTYKVLPRCQDGNFSTRVPFNANWKRSDQLPILPLGEGDTWANPAAHFRTPDEYRTLSHESWAPSHSFIYRDSPK